MKVTANKQSANKHSHVIGPDGSVLTPLNLPPADTIRWVARRKAEVIAAVHGGLLTMAEACRRYRLSAEEFLEWEQNYEAQGLEGLRVSARQRQRGSSSNRSLH